MIDRHELLATLKPLVGELEESIRERALSTPEIAEHLESEHQKAVVAGRTATSLEEWRDAEITQAAVAWILGCVFVRFLEDNGLIDEALISGPGGRRAAALGHREEHFRTRPEHSDREYFEACFRTVAAFPAVAELYDERHNPLWRLGPTADGARTLRETFTAIDPETGTLVHDFTDLELGTRFLGDLYQDLSEAAKKRYALLQTPDFVERFILDRTLTPAIDEFGLDEVRLIDPTCGSGHFLIGAFERLLALWTQREPGTNAVVLAQRALGQVAGVDLNPYATAIARFRLVIVALRACGITRLAEAPALKLHLATGDSLLHGPLPFDGAGLLFDANRLNKNIAHVYESEDAAALKEILGRGYHAVVGNPPYIAVQDAALRDAYRSRYATCHGKYVMTIPFMERFFELAQITGAGGRPLAGFVGKITGNNFMKRDFGAPLVTTFLPSIDVQTVIDTSGAYIPGHGTPTVLFFGRSRAPVTNALRVVDGIRGEPRQPADPGSGEVWSAIKRLVDDPGNQDAYVRSSDVPRSELFVHPMTLGIGRGLKRRLEEGRKTVGDVADSLGITAFTLEDDAYLLPRFKVRDADIERWRLLVEGDRVRDWRVSPSRAAVFPYDEDLVPLGEEPGSAWLRHLWPFKTTLANSRMFGTQSKVEAGLQWFEFGRLTTSKLRSPLTITWGFVATHNHFVLERGEKIFNRTAPVAKLSPGATEDMHLSLLSVLNSSAACFWLKQVCQNRGTGTDTAGARMRAESTWADFYDHDAGKVAGLPLPTRDSPRLAARLTQLGDEDETLLENLGFTSDGSSISIREQLGALHARADAVAARMTSLQEELDWQLLAAYGLAPDSLAVLGEDAPPIHAGERAFEIVLARQLAAGTATTTWFSRHGLIPITEPPTSWSPEYRRVVDERIALIESDPDVGLIERADHKRRWARPSWTERRDEAVTTLVLSALSERDLWSDLRPRSTAELTDHLRGTPMMLDALELLAENRDSDPAATVRRLVLEAAVPTLAAQRLTETGLRKRQVWERVWEIRRAEDRGDTAEAVLLPPRYAQSDFRSAIFWKHRGKLDVPKERFVLVPNAERGADTSPVVGWAGWNERDLARALAGRIMVLREQEAADAERVTPLLASVQELLPWIHQWHDESDPLYGGPPGQYFEGWLDGQLAELAITRDNLRAWRPPAPTRGRKAKAGAA
jgi:hypothetical protein